MKYLFLFVLTTTLYLNVQAKLPPCHQIVFENCLKQHLFLFGRRADVSEFITSPQGFENVCRNFNASLDCIRRHFSRCGSVIHTELFDLFTGGMQHDFYQFMCIDNPDRTAFFKHSSCIREHVFAVDRSIECLNNYPFSFEYITNNFISNNTQSLSDMINTICCGHQRKRQCTSQIATEYCGNETSAVFDRFFEQIHFGFFTAICGQHHDLDPDSELCIRALPPPSSSSSVNNIPEGFKSKSPISKLLYSYFPFNYIPVKQREQVHKLYAMLKNGN